MSDRIKHPTQVYSFGDFSRRTPNQQPPGDRLDAQFSDHAQVLNEVIVALNNDEARLVRKDDLAPELIDSLTRDVLLRTGMDAQAAAGAAMTSIHSAATALEAAIQSEASAVKASADAEVVRQGQGSVLSALEQLGAVASGHAITLQNAKQTVDNSANDAAKASAIAQDYAVLSQAWAENMPDTIPPNILATMDITGSHWSSRWWANQADGSAGAAEDWANAAAGSAADAAAALDQFTDLYLGPHPANPTLDNDGNPLQVGAVYYNTNDGNMYVWSGTQWTVSSSAKGWVPEAPIDTHTYVRGNASWLLSAGGIGEAPNDGNAYARKSVAWSQLNSNDVIFDTGPATVTGAVNLKASQIALTAETNARIAGDQANAASINGLKASNIANDSSVAGVTVKDALNTNLGAINANAAAIALKADAAATTSALALKANIASPVFTGDPQAPTPAPGDNDTSIPTTAWVNTAVGAALALKPSVIVSSTAPGTPIDNAMWWESDTGYLFLRYNDGNSAQWVQLNAMPNMGSFATVAAMNAGDAAAVQKAGDSMSGGLTITKPFAAIGDEALTLSPSSGSAITVFNKPVGAFANLIYGKTAGTMRWSILNGNSTTETGSGNTGSDFQIIRYTDAGVVIDAPLFIKRSTGAVSFAGAVTSAASIAAATVTYNNLAYFGYPTASDFYIQLSGNIRTLAWRGGVYGIQFDNSTGTTTWVGNSTPTMQLDFGGNLTGIGNITVNSKGYQPGGGSWGAASDARIKTVEAEYTQGLDAVLALRPVVYHYNGNDSPAADKPSMHAKVLDKSFIGLVAQEAEIPMPELVSKGEGFIDGKAVDDLRTLDSTALIFALVNAVKELSAKVAALEAGAA